jgi:HEAT repeat protein
MTEPILDDAAYARIFGIKKKAERDFAEELVRALGKIDRALLPPPAPHPFAQLIVQHDVGALLDKLEHGSEREQKDAVDALAHVVADGDIVDAAARAAACDRLRAVLAKTKDVDTAVAIEKTLAIAGDAPTLLEQLKRLGDEDPGVVATAARLLGLGRYRPAVPVLRGLVTPERIYESRWVIWALGEIGDESALPTLEMGLAHAFRVVDCLIAVGKIGKLTSIPQLTPQLFTGLPEQKDAAVRALAMILDRNRDDALRMGALRDQLATTIERDLADASAPISGSTRFHMVLCLARLGQKLDEARVRRYLGLSLDESEARHVAAFVAKGATKTNPFTRARR